MGLALPLLRRRCGRGLLTLKEEGGRSFAATRREQQIAIVAVIVALLVVRSLFVFDLGLRRSRRTPAGARRRGIPASTLLDFGLLGPRTTILDREVISRNVPFKGRCGWYPSH